VGVSPLQLVNLHRNRRYFVIKLHTWFCLSYFLKTNIQCYCIYQYFMSINSFFQNRICFSIQPLLQLVNLHGSRRYFVIKLHIWFCLSYCLKTDIKVYCIYRYFMSINSFFNTVSVSRYSRPWPTLGRSTSFFLILLFYQKCSIQYPVLHNYYTAWFSLVRFFFCPMSGKIIYLCEKLNQKY
jgi:hypothetical protein